LTGRKKDLLIRAVFGFGGDILKAKKLIVTAS